MGIFGCGQGNGRLKSSRLKSSRSGSDRFKGDNSGSDSFGIYMVEKMKLLENLCKILMINVNKKTIWINTENT